MPETRTTHSEYAQRVRSASRSDLLRMLSATASQVTQKRMHGKKIEPPVVQEFTLAGVARTSLGRGNDHRSRDITPSLVYRMCQEYLETSYAPEDTQGTGEVLRPFMFEQFLAQLSPMHNIGRAHALFEHYLPAVDAAPSAAEFKHVLGVPTIADFTRIGFIIHIGSMLHAGTLPKTMLLSDTVAPLFSPLAVHEIIPFISRHYALPLKEHAALARAALDNRPRRQEGLAFNPLQAKPLVDMGQEYVAPAPHFLLDKFTGTGLYYTLADELESKFTNALGHAFEDYIADQLQLLRAPCMYREITYGKDQRKSCDFILVFDEMVLLVEVKASRPPESFRKSLTPARDLKSLVKARNQISKTSTRIKERHPSFVDIPGDRPVRGLVVTLEPHFISGTEAQEEILEGPEGHPILEVFSHDFEHFCAWHKQSDQLGQNLLEAWPLNSETHFRGLHGVQGGIGATNPIVEHHFGKAVDLEIIKSALHSAE